jgi:hypothetical protein
VFYTCDWKDLFPDCSLQSSASNMSDHCPLILRLNVTFKRKKRFHFESFWPKMQGFQEVVADSWNASISAACPMERLSIKFKRLAKDLQSWSKKSVGNVSTQLALAKMTLPLLEIHKTTDLCGRLKSGCGKTKIIMSSPFFFGKNHC